VLRPHPQERPQEGAARAGSGPVRGAPAGRRAAPLRHGPGPPEGPPARRRLHLHARLGGRQAVGARLRSLPTRVRGHVLRQPRPERLHRRARRRPRAAGDGCGSWPSSQPRGRAPRCETETTDIRRPSALDRGRAGGGGGLDEGDRGPPPAPPRQGRGGRRPLRRPRRLRREGARGLPPPRGRPGAAPAPRRRRAAASAGRARAAPRLPERLRERARRPCGVEPRPRTRPRGGGPPRRGREPVPGARPGRHRLRGRALRQLAAGRALGDAAREARVAVSRDLGPAALDWAVPVVFARDPREPMR
jgi:hypothetical protein